MSPALPEQWSRARWAGIITALFMLQAGAVFLVSREPDMTPQHATMPVPRFTLSFRNVPTQAGASDPAAFALAGRNDFSRSAWLNRPRPVHQLNDWQDDGAWWNYPTNRLTRDFKTLVHSTVMTRPAARELPPQPIKPPETDDTELALLNSTVDLDAALQARGLVQPITPPEVQTSDVLPPTRVQISLNKDGLVLSALIVSGSGNREVDALALRLATNAQFRDAADPGAAPQVGTLTFRWFTVPPVETTAKQ